jgi:pimeloyl-ACP methyl ester carboxylesterase
VRTRRLTFGCAAVLVAFVLAGSVQAAAGSSQLSFIPCPGKTGFACASLPVPLARDGAVPGSISLSIERHSAASRPSSSAVVALAGGPGQAALPLSEFIAAAIAPALHSRDLLVFDQRGTGSSDPLGCSAIERISREPPTTLYERCALQIGPARGYFTTAESVQDLEALRVAAGYEKLVLYGTSYGTKVALEYAERYPQHVEALLLDSVVPADGRDPFSIATFQAIPGVLRELCAANACAGITSNPVADLARLTARLRRRSLGGSVFDGHGRHHAAAIDEAGLLDTIVAGDLNPALRALLPAAMRSALRGDPDPLLRLHVLSEGLIPTLPREPNPSQHPEPVDEALFATTTCEETPFPWSRSAGASTRLAEAHAYLEAQPSSDFYPFDTATAYGVSPLEACAAWPDASPPPPAETPLPDVPTLILSGEQDVRTPTSNALRVAAQIPDAQLEVVPYTGHSVLGSDVSECSERAVAAFFAGHPLAPCAPRPDPFSPTPVSPTRLARVRAPHGLPGRPGETLVAALDAIVDLSRQVIGATIQANAELPSGSSFGGLRGGYARLTGSAAILHDFSYVPGVALTGRLEVGPGGLAPTTLHISGTQAADGTVHLGTNFKHVSGTLGGRRFLLSVAHVRLSSLGGGEWPARAPVGSGWWQTR